MSIPGDTHAAELHSVPLALYGRYRVYFRLTLHVALYTHEAN